MLLGLLLPGTLGSRRGTDSLYDSQAGIAAPCS